MRVFTRFLFTLLLCAIGVTNVQADETIALTQDMFKTWDGYGADASATGTATVDFNIGNDAEISAGGMVCGTGSVLYLTYADLSGATKMIIEGTAGLQLRVLMNRQESNSGPLVEKNPNIGEDGKVELDLSDLAYVHVNAIKLGWGSSAGKITSISYVMPSDPLAIPKEALKNAIARGKMQNAIAYTAESFATLTQAISAGETALAAEDATEESLTSATNAINNAIASLALAAGYTNLTKDIFMTHTSQGDAEGTANSGCAYVLNEGSGLPYGLSTVDWLNYADLSAYDKLVVTVASGAPRFCFNRLTADGQDNDDESLSKMIDIPNNSRSTADYETVDESQKVFTIDLKKMVSNKGFAYLHCIKGANWANVTVTGMFLYKTPGHTYTVAGDSEAAFGTTWNPSETANDMVKQEDGTYMWKKENITLGAGSISFKVCEDHAWGIAYPADNYVLSIPAAGIYTVTITYNPTNDNAVNAQAEKTADAVVIPTIAMHGNFTGSWEDTKNFAIAEDNATASLTMTLNEGSYEFGMRIGGSGNWTSNGAVFTRENNSAEVTTGSGNLKLTADAAGDYTFTWTYASNTLAIGFPAAAAPAKYYLTGDSAFVVDAGLTADKAWTPNALKAEQDTLKVNLKAKQEYKVKLTVNGTWENNKGYAQLTEKTEGLTTDGDGNIIFTLAEAGDLTVVYNDSVFRLAGNFYIPFDSLLQVAEALAADAEAVAVGKLTDAIDAYKADANKETLQAAIDQFKADNADQEADQTAKVATNGWKKFETNENAALAPDWAAPSITTYDGRTTQPAEVYEGYGNTTGQIIYQDITGLTNGSYKVGFFGNAASTSERDGFTCNIKEGDEDVAYVFANDQKAYIKAHIATSITAYELSEFNVEVTDGTIKLGMGKDKTESTNWHTMQIYRLTWFTTAKAVYAGLKTDMEKALREASVLAADETKTKGKDALNAAIEAAKAALASNKLNIAEFEAELKALNDAITAFKLASRSLVNGVAYIIDTESGKFVAAGHKYGTQGIVNEYGLDLTFKADSIARTVTIETKVKNNDTDHFLGENLYMDSPAYGWILEYQGFGFYISNQNGQYLSIDAEDNLALSATPKEWIIVTADGVKEQRLSELAEATEEAPKDATWLLQNPNFNRNDQRVSAWTVSEDCTNKNLNGGNNVNNCAESYHSVFTISQLVEGAPAGKYTLTAQGFYRQDGETAEDAPVFFANNDSIAVPVKTGEENSMSNASESFTAGSYTIEPLEFIVEEDGKLNVGIKGTAANQWVIFDNFKLTYYGASAVASKVYILGDLNNWDRTAMTEMTFNEETQAFEYEYAPTTTAYITFSSKQMTAEEAAADVDWSNFNANYRYAVQAGNTAVTLNEAMPLTKGVDGNIILKAVKSETTYKISVDKNLASVTITGEAETIVPAKYYLVGSMNGWTITETNSDTYKLTLNSKAGEGIEEYMINITLDANDEFKVKSDGDVWYPDGMGNNYVIEEAGTYTVYFRPDGQGGETWHYGYINAVKSTVTGIDTAKTVNLENAVIYNLNGQKVNKAQKGLYIVNGKLVVIK